jgi:hypothetical protein
MEHMTMVGNVFDAVDFKQFTDSWFDGLVENLTFRYA